MSEGSYNIRNILLAIIIIFTIVIASTAAYLFTTSKPARETYIKSESQNFKKYSSQIKQLYKDFYTYQKPYMESKYKNRVELTANIKSDNDDIFGLPNATNIFDIINKCKLIYDSNINPTAKETNTKLELLLEKAPMIDLGVYTKGRELGFTIPVLLPDKYFVANLDKADEVYDRYYERYNINFIKPKRLFRWADIAQAIKFSDDELDGIAKDYGSFISGMIAKENVSFGQTVKSVIAGEEKSCKQIVVNLSPDKTKRLMQGLLEKISNDDRLLRLTYENYADVIRIIDEAGLFQLIKLLDETGSLKLNDIVKSYIENINIKKDLNKFKGDIKALASTTNYPDGLKMILTVDKAGNIVDRKVTTSYSITVEGDKKTINIHTASNDLKNDDLKNGLFEITFTNAGQISMWSINTNITPQPKNNDSKGKIGVTCTTKKNDAVQLSMQANFDVEKVTDELTLKVNNKIKYDVRYSAGGAAQADRLSGEFNSTNWKNNKNKTRNSNAGFSVNVDLPSQNIRDAAFKLEWKKENKFDIDFTLPQIEEANKINLNTITEDNLLDVENEMLKSFGTFYLKNKPIMDALFGR